MNILFSIPYSTKLVLGADKAHLLGELCAAQLITEEGWGSDKKYKASKETPVVEFVANLAVADLPPLIQELQERVNTSERKWLEMYNEKNKEKKRADELQEKLDKITAQVAT